MDDKNHNVLLIVYVLQSLFLNFELLELASKCTEKSELPWFEFEFITPEFDINVVRIRLLFCWPFRMPRLMLYEWLKAVMFLEEFWWGYWGLGVAFWLIGVWLSVVRMRSVRSVLVSIVCFIVFLVFLSSVLKSWILKLISVNS